MYLIYIGAWAHTELYTALYTVRGVGSGSRDVDAWRANVAVRRGSGAPSTDDPGVCQHCGDSMLWHFVPRLVRPDPRVRQRILDRCDPAYPSGPHWFFPSVCKNSFIQVCHVVQDLLTWPLLHANCRVLLQRAAARLGLRRNMAPRIWSPDSLMSCLLWIDKARATKKGDTQVRW